MRKRESKVDTALGYVNTYLDCDCLTRSMRNRDDLLVDLPTEIFEIKKSHLCREIFLGESSVEGFEELESTERWKILFIYCN